MVFKPEDNGKGAYIAADTIYLESDRIEFQESTAENDQRLTSDFITYCQIIISLPLHLIAKRSYLN